MAAPLNWLDRMVGAVSPAAGLRRAEARRLLTARAQYDGATQGRRAFGWKRRQSDANFELNPLAQLALRGIAHDLVRNNAYAARAVAGIAEHMVGAGITFHVARGGKKDDRLTALAQAHFETTACDAEGRSNLYGLQLQAARSVVTAGAVLARRRWRRITDRLPLPFQLQLLEPDYINTQLTGPLDNGGYRLQGIEFDAIGRRTGYQLYSGHPGGLLVDRFETTLVAATDVAHCFRADRPEQQHGATWFAPVVVRMKDFGDYADAQLVKQKISAAYTAFRIGDPDSDPAPTTDSNGGDITIEPNQEYLEPGLIMDVPGGSSIEFASPPSVEGYSDVMRIGAQEIAAGVGLPYDLMTGDLSQVSFISGRLGRLQFKRSIETWQWSMLIPQFCDPAGRFFLEAAALMGENVDGAAFVWAPPRFEMMDPASEVPAAVAAIRGGLTTLSASLRADGLDPEVVFAERAADDARLDALGIVLDSDPRRVTAVGNPMGGPANADARSPKPAADPATVPPAKAPPAKAPAKARP